MAVKIRLKRMGKKSTPFYRIVIADSRKKRDGRVIEEIGTYDPKADPSIIKVDGERAQYWLGVGAQPSEAVAALLKITGDIGGKSSLKVAEPKRDKAEIFNEALKELHNEPKVDATTKKANAAKKAAAKAEEDAKAAETKSDEPAAEEAKVEEAPAEEAKVEEPAAEEVKAEDAPAAEEAPAEEAAADEAKA